MKTNFRKLPKSEIEIDFELSAEEFGKHAEGALLHYRESVKMDGFRQGHAPLNMVEQRVGAENLLMEAGDLAVKDAYGKFVADNNLEPVGSPEVKIKKIAKGSPFEFSVKVAVLPEIKLPDYKKIAAGIKNEPVLVDEKEIEDSLTYLQKSRAKFSQVSRGTENKDFVEIEYQNEKINGEKIVKDRFIMGEGGFTKDFEGNLLGMKAGEEKDFVAKFPENITDKSIAGKDGNFKVKMVSVQKMELPPLDDEFVKNLGKFEGMAALKDNIREGITAEKEYVEKERRRMEILEKIAEKIDFDLPEKMVDYEQENSFKEMKTNVIGRMKITFEEYLSLVRKTEEEIKKSFRAEAERKIKNYLILRGIKKAEDISATEAEIEGELNKMIKNYSSDQLKQFDIDRAKEYIRDTICNEKIFQMLEKPSQN